MRYRTAVWSGALLSVLLGTPMAQERTAPPSTQQLIERLGDDSYRVRRDAESALGEMGEEALDVLRSAAENHEDEEVRWRARRLVQRLERGDEPGGLRQRLNRDVEAPQGLPRTRFFFPGMGGSRDLDEIFDRVFGELERDFGMDVPRERFFQDDFFKDLEEQMGELRRRVEDGRRGGMTFGPGWNFDSNSQSVSVQIGPDGVRLEVQKTDEDGQPDTEVYEAPDMETFREQYPDIAEQYMSGGTGSRAFSMGPGNLRVFGLDPALDTRRWFPRSTTPGLRLRQGGDTPPQILELTEESTPAPPPEGKRLGVLIRTVSPDVSDYLGLDQGLGLLVEEVEEDSLAEDLGIRKGDIVVEIGGVEIRGVESVQESLGAIEAGESVVVEVNRRGETVELQAEKRKSADSVKNR